MRLYVKALERIETENIWFKVLIITQHRKITGKLQYDDARSRQESPKVIGGHGQSIWNVGSYAAGKKRKYACV